MKGNPMPLKLKIVLVSTLSMLTFGVATSTALATPRWLVAGTKVAAGAKFSIGLEGTLSATNALIFESGQAEITCKTIDIEAAWIEGETKGGGKNLVFGKCSAPKPEHCAVANEGQISTGEVRARILPSEIKPEVTFEPLNGTAFAEFKLEDSGGTCALNGKKFRISGIANGVIVTPTEDAVLKELNFNTGANELEVNGERASLVGSISVKLLLGFVWGIA
jgi:hypothetical protein